MLLERPVPRFQSTPSSRRETHRSCLRKDRAWDFNPLPPRGGRLRGDRRKSASSHFNPLPPRGGRRGHAFAQNRPSGNFNPLPPRGGRPGTRRRMAILPLRFQSTPSSRRETGFFHADEILATISIHSLLAEGDASRRGGAGSGDGFQSTPSSRRETAGRRSYSSHVVISIHSLLAEGDPA